MNETTKTQITMDHLDEFLLAMTTNPRLTANERIAIGQVRNAIGDLLEELDQPYAQTVLDMTGRVVDWQGPLV